MVCTKEQIKKLMKYTRTCTREVAAVKAGMSIRTARKYMKQKGMVAQIERDWRTKPDPFAEVWSELKGMLTKDTGLQAKTLMEWLIEREPEKFQANQLRTLQRKLRNWRALDGPEQDIVFPQIHIPGKQSQSDYTCCNKLGVLIAGEEFPHLLFHFMLPYSRWETVSIAFSESFETLTNGYALAVKELDAVAVEHRTDNLSAAVHMDGNRKRFNSRWKDFLDHYGVTPSSNNPGESQENGSVEKSHDLFKTMLDQRLMLRGSRNFGSVDAYEAFLHDILYRRNKDRKAKVVEELGYLKALPSRDWKDPLEYSASVGPASTVVVMRATYSVPSRLIGRDLRALVYANKIELYFGDKLVQEMNKQPAGGQLIQYRHVVNQLLRKPGAFAGYRYREELYPSSVFRRAYDRLCDGSIDRGEKEYLKILQLAAFGSEAEVAVPLEALLEASSCPTASAVKDLIEVKAELPTVEVQVVDTQSYDSLLVFPNALREEVPA
jgi:hypothetical protein